VRFAGYCLAEARRHGFDGNSRSDLALIVPADAIGNREEPAV
jgi:hypothetical protein